MAVPSKVAAEELQRIARRSYVQRNFQVALINSPGDPSAATLWDEIKDKEVGFNLATAPGGYTRQGFSFDDGDIDVYADGKRSLARRTVTFEHTASFGDSIRFTHVAVLSNDSEGEKLVSLTRLASTATLSDGQKAIFNFDFTLYGVYVVE